MLAVCDIKTIAVSGRAVNDANFLSNGDLTDIFLYFCFRKAKLKAPCLILFMSLRNDEYDTDYR